MFQEVKLFSHLAQMWTQVLFFCQTMDSLIPTSSRLLPLHTIESGTFLFLELIYVQGQYIPRFPLSHLVFCAEKILRNISSF